MKKILPTLWLMAISCFISSNVNAELLDNGKFTSDTEEGIDWLDLTETSGLSYEYVSSQLGTGGRFEGWSFASREQINTFFSNAGFVKNLKTSSNIVPVSRLLNLWGVISLRANKETGDGSKFMYGEPYVIGPPKKHNQRVYVGFIGKTGATGKERGLVLLNNVKSSLSIKESNDKTGSALIRRSK
ncbi:MAG: hypothetical protein OQK98_06255 [Gammaproteobacteria bacterium]|nr:hypothetical protein [Gammaproteobacteria bacterium]